MVIYTPLADETGLYLRVRDFLANDGARRWMGYLQGYPLGDFDRHTKPMLTHAKVSLVQAGWKPEERFAHEWMAGYLPLPLRVCSAEQLYRAFRRWCEVNGERFPPPQGRFTESLKRWVNEHAALSDDGPRLVYKVVALADEDGRRAVRCWLPTGTGPLPGVSEGAWAADSVRSYEHALHAYAKASKGGSFEHDD